MKMIEGGVTAAQGFVAGGIHCGVRKNKSKPDLAMIYSEKPCAAAAVSFAVFPAWRTCLA